MKMDNENEKKNPQGPEETAAPETTPAPEAEPQAAPEQKTEEAKTAEPEKKQPEQPKQHKVKEYVSSTRFKRGGISTAFTAGFLIVVILLNVIVGLLSDRFPSMNLDLTKNSSNTLSEQAAKVVDGVKQAVTITILATEDQTKNDQVLSNYGLKYSQVGILAAKMAERNSNIKVQYVDLVKNPTFAADYKSDNLTQGDVIIKSDKRDRVLTYDQLFNIQYGQDGSTQTYSLVDSALASGVNSVIAETLPVVAFDTGHSEQLDGTTYKQLLANNSFETKDFNLLTEAIPEKTQMIVLGCPTTDYTEAEIKKLDDFLASTSLAGDRSLIVTFDPSQKEMPKFATFLKEWGIGVKQAVVVESDQTKVLGSNASYILSNVDSDVTLNGTSDYGYFTTPQSVPVDILSQSTSGRATYSLAKSNATCYLVDSSTKSTDNPAKAAYNTGVLSQGQVKSGDKTYKANVIALGSTAMFAQQILGTNALGNSKYVVDLSKYATGTTNAATAVTSVSQQTNVTDITLSAAQSTLLGLGVFTILIPLLIAVAGIVVFRKRRHL